VGHGLDAHSGAKSGIACTLSGCDFRPLTTRSRRIDYADHLLTVEPGDAVTMELDPDEYPLLEGWLYENEPLSDILMTRQEPLSHHVHVNGPSYKEWRLSTPIMAQLYNLAEPMLSTHPDNNHK
jgi:pre-mRNA-processing factor 8